MPRPVQPARASVSFNVLCGIPKARHTAALLVPCSRAAMTTDSSFSASTDNGRPPGHPRRLAVASPARPGPVLGSGSVRIEPGPRRDGKAARRAPWWCPFVRSATGTPPRYPEPGHDLEQVGQRPPQAVELPTTRQSPGFINPSACARPGRSSLAPLALSENKCRSSTPAAIRASRYKLHVWRSLSDDTRM